MTTITVPSRNNIIMSIIINKGNCSHIDCTAATPSGKFICPLYVTGCNHGNEKNLIYHRAVQWLIDTYGKEEAQAMLVEMLI